MCYLGVLILLSPIAVVVGCDPLDVTGAVGDLLLAMGDISCIIFSFSIGSSLIVVVIFSVITLFFVFLLSPQFPGRTKYILQPFLSVSY